MVHTIPEGLNDPALVFVDGTMSRSGSGGWKSTKTWQEI